MKTEIQQHDDHFLVTLEGEFNTAAAVEAEETLKPLRESTDRDVIVECENLDYIASSGLRILLAILKHVKAAGHTMTLRHVNDDIMDVFRLTGFNTLFNFEN